MRGRSHRFQSVDPHDDWVDGSWTVDCVCGVTFDDGEEMVNCDECGVWVHTRCSKYVKGEESFACDKCKKKNNWNSSHNDSEETEVAQLLVELPTKTMRLESSYSVPARRPVRLWTDIPMENRVHAQGIPGGDPELFTGLSSVFTPELWKCTGYVPKKFNFQYKEFPCWDEKGGCKKKEENDIENENPVDKGAGVLFSLSKDRVLATPVSALVGTIGRGEENGFEKKVYSKETKQWDCEGVNVRHSQNGLKKERSLLRPIMVHSGKQKKEDLGMTKDHSGKKKTRASEKDTDEKRKDLHASRTVFRPTSDAKQLEFYEDRGLKSSMADIQSIKNKNLPEDMHQESVSDGHLLVDDDADKAKNELAINENPLDAFPSEASRLDFSNVDALEEDVAGHQVPATTRSSPPTDGVSGSTLEHNDCQKIAVKLEVDNVAVDRLDDSMEASTRSVGKPLTEDVTGNMVEVLDNQIPKDLSGDVSQTSLLPNVEVKTEAEENSLGNLNLQSAPGDPKVQCKPYDDMPKISKVNDVVGSSTQSSGPKAQGPKRSSEAISDCCAVNIHEVSGDPCQVKQEVGGSDCPVEVQKSSLEFKHNPGIAKEQAKYEVSSLNPPALTNQRKIVVSMGKSSSSFNKSCASEDSKSANAQNSNLNSKQGETFDGNASIKKDRDVSDEEKHDMLKKTVKEHSKSSVNSVSKVSPFGRTSNATVSKRTVSDAKDFVPVSSSKLSLVQAVAVTSGSGDSAVSLQSQVAVHAQNKSSTSTLPLKGEKLSQSNLQPPPKVNHAPSMHPPAVVNSPTTLSDEELALLLHQELNSSPRVPRVPRVRHTGSLPQLSSPTATSILVKRSSSSGGKDHNLVSRRKNKDTSRDGVRYSRELDDEARKTDRVSSSPDLRRQDLGYTADGYTRKEDSGSPAVHSVKMNTPSASTTTANSGPSFSVEVNDHNVSSVRNSPRNISDDDAGTNRGPVHRTLPGLINEIMSKGRRMTYEELCNAVLPHWPHLRKHNGERYAYSSHSQAVLDCLRNRHEWARLVDRGPKTSSSKKRRKLDADESEDNEYGDGGTGRELESKSLESQREEFPKGKRKARKRRPALQGREIKDVRKRQKVDLPSDNDDGLFSNSSEDSVFSEDETHGDGEASDSSDEMGTT